MIAAPMQAVVVVVVFVLYFGYEDVCPPIHTHPPCSVSPHPATYTCAQAHAHTHLHMAWTTLRHTSGHGSKLTYIYIYIQMQNIADNSVRFLLLI